MVSVGVMTIDGGTTGVLEAVLSFRGHARWSKGQECVWDVGCHLLPPENTEFSAGLRPDVTKQNHNFGKIQSFSSEWTHRSGGL